MEHQKNPRNLEDILEELVSHFEAVADEAEGTEQEARKETELATVLKHCEEVAINLHIQYDCLLEVGFTEEQAIELLTTMIGRR